MPTSRSELRASTPRRAPRGPKQTRLGTGELQARLSSSTGRIRVQSCLSLTQESLVTGEDVHTRGFLKLNRVRLENIVPHQRVSESQS